MHHIQTDKKISSNWIFIQMCVALLLGAGTSCQESSIEVKSKKKEGAGTKDCATRSVADCSADGQTNCLANADFKSVEMTRVSTERIRAGVSLAGVAGTLGFLPTDISGMTDWFAADNGVVTTSASRVATWSNLITGGATAVGGAAENYMASGVLTPDNAKQPLFSSLYGKPSISFTASNSENLIYPGQSLPKTVIVVNRTTSNLSDSALLSGFSADFFGGTPSFPWSSKLEAASFNLRFYIQKLDYLIGDQVAQSGWSGVTNGPSQVLNQTVISIGSFDGTTINAEQSSGAATSNYLLTPKNTIVTGIGIAFWGSILYGFFDGHIFEILVFDRVLTSTETSKIKDYLTAKYGI
jgi:hypothetical protein